MTGIKKNKYHIEGDSIYLREVRLSDVNENYHRWLNDPEVNKYLETRFAPQTIDSIKEYVEKMSQKADEIFLAICDKATDKHIGNIKLGPINPHHKYADISLVIGDKDFWGKGIATEAIKLISDYAFVQLGLHKVSAGCYSDNIGSAKAFHKVGFTEEGRLKKHYLDANNNYIDRICLGLVNSKEQGGAQ
ncbi:GNAT family N-acetyltransferase [Candidatus Margulisiibacteriota bacterium]